MLAHVDCNSFYCSCEAAFNPRLRGKPIIVLSNNDGCAIARNPEAKALGVEMGAPWHLHRDQWKEWGVVIFSSNYALYGDVSRRVMETLAGFTDHLEIYSIDEAFLAVEEWTPAQLEGFAREVRERVAGWTGIPVGVGIGKTKVLAKLANRAAKKSGGVCVLDHASDGGRALLDAWPCSDVWGIAGRLAARLAALGIHTAGELARAPRATVRRRLGVVGERIALELVGVPCLALEEVQPNRQNICCSRSFGHPVESLESLREAVATHATRGGEKLRRQRLAASAVHVFACTNPPRPDLLQHFPSAGRELLVPTAFGPELVGEAMRVLEAIFRPGYEYTKAGVLLLGLVPDDEQQESLFRPVDRERQEKEKRLMAAVDALNLWGGRGTVRPASTGTRHAWAMRRQHLSPRYTTRWEDVPVARME